VAPLKLGNVELEMLVVDVLELADYLTGNIGALFVCKAPNGYKSFGNYILDALVTQRVAGLQHFSFLYSFSILTKSGSHLLSVQYLRQFI